MDDRGDLKKIFSRRTFLLMGGQAALTATLMSRLYYLGITQSSHYQTLARDNSVRLEIILPQRGRILDRFGHVMSSSKSSYNLMLDTVLAPDSKAVLEELQKFLHLDNEDVESLKSELKKPSFKNHPLLKENLSWDDVCILEVHAHELQGTYIQEGSCRYYPDEINTPHFMGYVQKPSSEDKSDSVGARLPNFRVGKSGVEKQFETLLSGHPGFREVEVNARGKVVRELSINESERGKDLYLTIDHELQQTTQRILSAHESASAIIMDLKRGEVLALASVPTFDPNLFTNGIKRDDWQNLLDNPYGILNNKAISGLYSPGSIFKLPFALAALNAPHIPKNFQATCQGHMMLGNHRFHCWKKEGHGTLDLEGAIQRSCDVYFYQLAKLMKMEKVTDMAHHLGLGALTGIELPQEKIGLIPTKEWKKKRTGVSWHTGDTVLLSIGQGSILTTPIQLCVLMSRLALNNLNFKPTLFRSIEHNQDPVIDETVLKAVSDKDLERIKKGLYAAVNEPGGTAYSARILDPNFAMAGKTTTAQVTRITMQQREKGIPAQHEIPWKHRHHAMFAGYAPAQEPRFALSVVIEHGGGGGKVAAPIARDLMLETFKRYA